MLTFKEFLEEVRKVDQWRHDTGDWRGPHEGRELELMLAGKKPAALVNKKEFREKWKPHIKSGKFIHREITFGGGRTKAHVVALAGHERRIHRLSAEFEKPERDHAKMVTQRMPYENSLTQ